MGIMLFVYQMFVSVILIGIGGLICLVTLVLFFIEWLRDRCEDSN